MKSILKARQKKLSTILEKNTDLILLLNPHSRKRNNDAHFPYRADSNTFYISGLEHENTAVLFYKKNSSLKSICFIPKANKLRDLWEGKTINKKMATELGFDEIRDYEELEEEMIHFYSHQEKGAFTRLYSNIQSNPEHQAWLTRTLKRIPNVLRAGKSPPQAQIQIENFIGKIRIQKDAHEIQLLKKASEVNVKAHKLLMQNLNSGMNESEAQGIIEGAFKAYGATCPSYNSIIGAGSNALCLHYTDNNATIKKNDLILVDAGCEYNYYASDITRCYPADGEFTDAQKVIYNIVLKIQKNALKLCKAGLLPSKLHKKVASDLEKEIMKSKILKISPSAFKKKNLIKELFPHGTGHWIGLDVHDQSPSFENGKEIPYLKNSVITVEPGIYIPKNCSYIKKEYRGIGVRIEDCLVIKENAKKTINLTEKLPKEIVEIEALMSQN